MNDIESYCDDYIAEVLRDISNEDLSDLYQSFLLRVPRNGMILDAGCGWGRDTLYFRRHGYEVVAFESSAELCRAANTIAGRSIRNHSFDSVDWESKFDGVWACNSLHVIPRNSIDSIFLKFSRALKPEGVLLVSLEQWGVDWEASPFVPGCDERNLLQLIRTHASCFALDAVWASSTSVNALLFRR